MISNVKFHNDCFSDFFVIIFSVSVNFQDLELHISYDQFLLVLHNQTNG